jgi:hypothetical protein
MILVVVGATAVVALLLALVVFVGIVVAGVFVVVAVVVAVVVGITAAVALLVAFVDVPSCTLPLPIAVFAMDPLLLEPVGGILEAIAVSTLLGIEGELMALAESCGASSCNVRAVSRAAASISGTPTLPNEFVNNVGTGCFKRSLATFIHAVINSCAPSRALLRMIPR